MLFCFFLFGRWKKSKLQESALSDISGRLIFCIVAVVLTFSVYVLVNKELDPVLWRSMASILFNISKPRRHRDGLEHKAFEQKEPRLDVRHAPATSLACHRSFASFLCFQLDSRSPRTGFASQHCRPLHLWGSRPNLQLLSVLILQGSKLDVLEQFYFIHAALLSILLLNSRMDRFSDLISIDSFRYNSLFLLRIAKIVQLILTEVLNELALLSLEGKLSHKLWKAMHIYKVDNI